MIRWSFGSRFTFDPLEAVLMGFNTELAVRLGDRRATAPAAWALSLFARWCAWQVLDQREQHTGAKRFLETGDPELLEELFQLAKDFPGPATSACLEAVQGNAILGAKNAAPFAVEAIGRTAVSRSLEQLLSWVVGVTGQINADKLPIDDDLKAEIAVAADAAQLNLHSARSLPEGVLPFAPVQADYSWPISSSNSASS